MTAEVIARCWASDVCPRETLSALSGLKEKGGQATGRARAQSLERDGPKPGPGRSAAEIVSSQLFIIGSSDAEYYHQFRPVSSIIPNLLAFFLTRAEDVI